MGKTVKRILSATVLIAFIVTALSTPFCNWIFLFVLVLFFSLAALYEFYHLCDRGYEGRSLNVVGYIFSILILLSYYAQYLSIIGIQGSECSGIFRVFVGIFYPGMNLLPLFLVLFVVSSHIIQLIFRPMHGTTYSVSTTGFGLLYTVLPFSYSLLFLTLHNGMFYLIFVIFATVMTDTGAYFAGRWFGKHNARLQTSPRKTYEGYVGGIIVSNLTSLLFLVLARQYLPEMYAPPELSTIEAVILVFFISMLSIMGDLAESALKRDANKKDSASVIPGHGGVLDLADALLITIPVTYFYFLFKVF